MRTIIFLVVGTGLILGVLTVGYGMPASDLLIIAAMVGGGVALGLALRRWMDRRETKELSRRAGAQGTAFDVGVEHTSGGGAVYYSVKTTFAGDPAWFTLYDLKQSAGFRLFKRLGLSHRLAIGDDEFNREIYVERNPEMGAVLFASAERREAARAVFRLGFSTIQYRGGLLWALHKGEVPDDVAVAVRPHLLVLAAKPGEVPDQPLQQPGVAASRASASEGGIMQTQKEPSIPASVIVSVLLDLAILTVILTGGLILVTSGQLRLDVYTVIFIVVGIVVGIGVMEHAFRVITTLRTLLRARKRLRAERGHKP